MEAFMFKGKEYIYEVYKTRNFSKAATNLFISQPSLSATVKKIEQRLGTPIFDRSVNPIQLTECGQKYIQYIEQIFDLENDFKAYLNDITTLNTGHLTIGGSNLFSSYILPSFVSSFIARYPNIDVKLIEDNTKSLETLLSKGSLDLLIDYSALNPSVYDRALFGSEHLLLAVPRHYSVNEMLTDSVLMQEEILQDTYLEDNVPTVSLKLFQDLPFVLMRPGNNTREHSNRLFKAFKIAPPVILELDQQATSYHITCSGMGISFISDTLIKQTPYDPRVCYYKIDSKHTRRNIYFYYKHTKYMSQAMKAFLHLSCHDFDKQ